MSPVRAGSVSIGAGCPLALLAGPCVIESTDHCLRMADALRRVAEHLGMPFVFKASYDKANRTSVESYRGPGLEAGLSALARVRAECGVPTLTDVHSPPEAAAAGSVVDMLQIPAFLCRQTDLLVAAGATNRPVNVKKGQFVSPETMIQAARKVEAGGAGGVLLCERGSVFGYGNLVVDMRGLVIMRELGYPVVFDATHSVQLPSAGGTVSGGDRRFVAHLSRAATAVGIDALFLEVHDDPDHALCDGPNMVALAELREMLETVLRVRDSVSLR